MTLSTKKYCPLRGSSHVATYCSAVTVVLVRSWVDQVGLNDRDGPVTMFPPYASGCFPVRSTKNERVISRACTMPVSVRCTQEKLPSLARAKQTRPRPDRKSK